MSQTVNVSGAAMVPFGRHDERSLQDLGQEAILAALDDAGIDRAEIEATYCGNVLGGMLPGQRTLRDLEMSGPPVFNVENACSSGATAVHLASQALRLGEYETVLVFGVEKLTALGGGALPLENSDYKTEWNTSRGLIMPAVYAMRARRYIEDHGIGLDILADISVKNHDHACLNPYAKYYKPMTREEILSSRMVADPLTLYQCCPSSVDGAAALILTTKPVSKRGRTVRLLASVIQSGRHEPGCDDITLDEITSRTARLAYERASLGPEDIDVIELHDAFTIAELIYYESLELCPRGEASRLVTEKQTSLGGSTVVNPSGGLLGKGHPLGATGVAQMVEIVWQLEGRADDRQVEGASVGLAHCTGGGISGMDHAACAVHILGR